MDTYKYLVVAMYLYIFIQIAIHFKWFQHKGYNVWFYFKEYPSGIDTYMSYENFCHFLDSNDKIWTKDTISVNVVNVYDGTRRKEKWTHKEGILYLVKKLSKGEHLEIMSLDKKTFTVRITK